MAYHDLVRRSIRAKLYRSIGLMGVVFLFSSIIVFISLISLGMYRGSQSVVERMGADLIVVPSGHEKELEGMLLTTQKGYFYMDSAVLDHIQTTAGVEKVSPQCFLMTLEVSCCDQAVQIVGIDTETDFTVRPWMERSYQQSLEEGAIVVGSRVGVRSDHTFQMFGKLYPVAAILDESGSAMDTTIYVSRQQMPTFLEAAREAKHGILEEVEPDQISAVMVKVAKGQQVAAVATKLSAIEGVDIVTADGVSRRLSNQLREGSFFYFVFAGVLWIIAFLILYVVQYMTIHERKKEIETFRMLGMSRQQVRAFLLEETLWLSGVGAVVGVVFGLVGFSVCEQLVKEQVQFPFAVPGIGQFLAVAAISLVITATSGPASAFWTVRSVCGKSADVYAKEVAA